ncbi:MAG: FtsX-like permease family protein [Fibrobacter sp.]|nr:FtsX-like permease family protein [Fibrobacter sp.]
MRLSKLLLTSSKSILRNRVRSFLTTLGIIIGVASVIIMVAIGKGAQQDIKDQIQSMGTNIIMIMPGSSSSRGLSQGSGSRQSLTLKDADKLRTIESLIAVSPLSRINSQVIGGSGNWQTQIYGVDPDYLAIREWDVISGDMFTKKDIATSSKVVVIGKTIADQLFADQDPIGQSIRIGKVPMKIVGVLDEKGQNAMGQDQDDIILAPVSTVLNRMSRQRHINQIMASASSMDVITDASAEIEMILRAAHRISDGDDADFQIRTQADIMDRATSTARTMTILLGAIAGVSLFVGGIGIMNIMLVSVTERTREIGIRMAIGARESDILLQFLIESIVLSSMGGIIGILIALGAIWGVTNIIGFNTSIDIATMFLAFIFSGAVGVFFGFYPARKAARLNPIEALRYE